MFIKEEIAEKKARVRELMTELHLEALLLKRTANFAWITGGGINYVGMTSDFGLAPVLITADKEYVISNNIEATRLRDEELMPDQGYQQEIYPWHDGGGEARIIERIVGKGKLGSDCGHPGSTDVSQKAAELRYSLTSWEVDRYMEFGRIVSECIEDVCKTVRPGERECNVTGRLAGRLWDYRIDTITNFCAADDRIGKYRHPLVTERKIRDRAMLCANARMKGLIISITRHVHFGIVPEVLRKIYDDNVYIDCLMMVNSVPGRKLVDPFLKGVEAYKMLGYDREWELHHQGGSIGYIGRDARVEWSTPGIIHKNQAFSWNPSITGSKSEDVMIATEDGVRLVSYPVSFPIKEVMVEGQALARPDILVL